MEVHNLQCIILEWQHNKPDFWSAFWQRHTRNDWGSHKKWFSSGHSAYRSRIDKGYWRFSRLESWKREKKSMKQHCSPGLQKGKCPGRSWLSLQKETPQPLWQPGSVLCRPHSAEVLHVWNYSVLQFFPIALCSTDLHHWKEPSSIHSTPALRIFTNIDKLPSQSSTEWTVPWLSTFPYVGDASGL